MINTQLDGYLIVSRRESTKSKNSFKLWFWDGSSSTEPRRVRIAGVNDLQHTEGIASVSIAGMSLLLLVSDEGNANKQKAAEVLFVNYDELEME